MSTRRLQIEVEQRRQADLGLRNALELKGKSERKLQSIVGHMPLGGDLWNAQDQLVVWNEKWAEYHQQDITNVAYGMTYESLLRLVTRGRRLRGIS